MPVGMTLQQLYSQPAYHGDASAPSASAMSMANATMAPPPPGAKRAVSPPTPADKEYPPRALHDGAGYPQERAQYADHHALQQPQQPPPPPPHYPPAYAQMPPPHSYAQQYHHHHHHHHQKSAPHADEYGLADPLPFEYLGLRKFPDAAKEHADHRYAPPMASGYDTGGGGGYSAAHSPHPSVYESQHAHPPKSVEERAYHQPAYPPHHGSERAFHPPPHHAAEHFPHAHLYSHSSQMNHAAAVAAAAAAGGGGGGGAAAAATAATATAAPASQHPPHHSFPPLLETQNLKKEAAGDPQAYSPHGPVEFTASAAAGPQSAGQEAVIKVKTPLKTKYWRNGRRNLQCFPSCKVFGDYSSIKIEDLKQHDFMWGKCRGSLITEVTLNSSVSFDDILILSRVHSMENVPVAFEEAVIRECMLGRMVEPDVMDTMKDQWITGERLPDFVQQDGNTACYEFKPKVWKYTEDMTQGKCKRRNVKYYVQFEAFVLVMSGERRYYACIGSGMSTAFEVGSSRVLARQKRKAASGLDANPLYLKNGQPVGSPSEMSPTAMPHQMMQQHPMMPQHGMHPQMYPPSYPPHGYGPPRGMPQGMHPSMMPPMHHGDGSQLHHGYHQAPPPQPAPMNAPPAPATGGQKRKASPTSNAGPRPSKAKKAAKDAQPAM